MFETLQATHFINMMYYVLPQITAVGNKLKI